MVVLRVRKYKDGYEVREKFHNTNFHTKVLGYGNEDRDKTDKGVLVKSAYTPEGYYIGDKRTAYFLCSKKGIKPELIDPSHKVCSIGFCPSEQKWYGWSHRAIFGFGIGDVVKEGDCTTTSGWIDEYLEEHPEKDLSLPVGFEAKTLEDCKRMAIAFADSVS